MTKPSFLELEDFSAGYASGQNVVESINMSVEKGQLVCLLGPSGCGKTTVLRAISGFQTPRTGQITLDGLELANAHHSLEPEKRNVGMVFQEHALFPHLTVKDNIGFGLNKIKSQIKAERIAQLLDLIGLTRLKNKYPHELSGGQSQRVALARALAPQPKLLLLDEAFSSLDRSLRETLGSQVREILKKLGMTAIMVTHDHHEAFTLGDAIGVMSQGRMLQWGRPQDLYSEPNSATVATFIGAGNLINSRILGRHEIAMDNKTSSELQASSSLGQLALSTINKKGFPEQGQEVQVLLRNEDIRVDPVSKVFARIISKSFDGSNLKLKLELDSGEAVNCLVNSTEQYNQGQRLAIRAIDREYQYFIS